MEQKDKKKKGEGKKGSKINDMREFITSVCASNDISENIKSELMKQYVKGNNQIKEDHDKKKEPGSQMMKESVCRNWARNEYMDKQNCRYRHPVKCEDQIRKGYCANSNNCGYYHPKICWDNRNMEKCRRGIGCTWDLFTCTDARLL